MRNGAVFLSRFATIRLILPSSFGRSDGGSRTRRRVPRARAREARLARLGRRRRARSRRRTRAWRPWMSLGAARPVGRTFGASGPGTSERAMSTSREEDTEKPSRYKRASHLGHATTARHPLVSFRSRDPHVRWQRRTPVARHSAGSRLRISARVLALGASGTHPPRCSWTFRGRACGEGPRTRARRSHRARHELVEPSCPLRSSSSRARLTDFHLRPRRFESRTVNSSFSTRFSAPKKGQQRTLGDAR